MDENVGEPYRWLTGTGQAKEIGPGVVVANTYLEMWNRELWVAEKTDAQEQAWQIIEGLERR